jgi:membrane protein YdbS with pleckstrin-like domain
MATRPEPALQRYLLDGERVVVAIHQHWAKISAPVAATVGGLLLALWVDASVPASVAALARAVWLGWFAVLGWTLWRLLEWRHDWFVATDKRLILTYGLITRRVAMMPLTKVTDMSYSRSVPGRLLGYGQFIMGSAGQDQALHNINWVPDPDHTYRAICSEMFGVQDHLRAPGGTAGMETDDDEEAGSFTDPRWSGSPSAVEEYGAHSRAIPVRRDESGAESIYQSEDLRRRSRSADTGPIPTVRPGSDD